MTAFDTNLGILFNLRLKLEFLLASSKLLKFVFIIALKFN